MVALVKENPAGIPLKKLSLFYNQTYHANLSFRALHFDSMANLVASRKELFVERELVFHKDHCPQSPAAARAESGAAAMGGASAKSLKDSKRSILKKVVAMMKEHPDGIPLKKVSIVYSQKYHQNLTLAQLGFKTISCLVESLEKDLGVMGEVVFHKIYLAQNQPRAGTKAKENSRPATPQTPDPLSRACSPAPPVPVSQWDTTSPHRVPLTQPRGNFLGSPVVSFGSSSSAQSIPGNSLVTASKPAEQLTQQQLYQRIMEVSYISTCIETLCASFIQI